MTRHDARLSSVERDRLADRARDPKVAAARERATEAERIVDRRLWAAVMLSRSLDVCVSAVAGRAVLARQLDGEALRRALRGGRLPRPDAYVEVTADMLDAVAEGGPFKLKAGGR